MKWKMYKLYLSEGIKRDLEIQASRENISSSMILKKLALGYLSGKITMPDFTQEELKTIKAPWAKSE